MTADAAAALKLVTSQPGAVPKKPWLKFFPADWRGDERLGMCSLAARAFLVELMCLMHTAEPYGYLLVNGRAPTDAELIRLVRATGVAELRRVRAELLERGVLSTAADGTLYSRRMVRTAARSAVGHATGKNGGSPRLTSPTLKGSDNSTLKGPANPYGSLASGLLSSPIEKSVSENEDSALIERLAVDFLEGLPEVYAKCRTGAAYHIAKINEPRDLAYAIDLARGWPSLERLNAMYEVFLLRPDIGDKNKPGTPGQFLHMAPDCDRLLREHRR